MEQWVFVVVNVVMVVVLMFLANYHRRTLASIDARADRHETRIESLEQNAVGKEDWLRDVALNRQRLEQILRRIDRMDGHNEAAVQIASAIAAVLSKEGKS